MGDTKEETVMKRHLTLTLMIATTLLLSSAVGVSANTGGTDRPVRATATGYGYWPGVGAPGSLDCPGYAVGETSFTYLAGTMAHLGRVTIEMRHCTIYPELGEFSTDTGVIDIVAANGDILRGTYDTWVTGFVDGQVLAEFVITFDGTGSSGRFAGATGTASGDIAITALGYDVNVWPVPHYHFGGTISY